MIDTSKTIIHSLSVHGIGNRSNQGILKLSDQPLAIEGELLRSMLLTYFFSSFRTPAYYSFMVDRLPHPVMQVAAAIFQDPDSLHERSVVLAERLYEETQHPHIKPGELYTAYFSGVGLEGQAFNAVGIFKSEVKENYLKLKERQKSYDLRAEEGINVQKLDKGCLILDDAGDQGYKILLVDTANRSEAQFWKDDFLGVKAWPDAFHHTQNFMNLTSQYVGDQLDEEFSVSKADKIDLLNRSMNFFKSRDQFNQNEFETEVLGDESVIESFRNYERTFKTDADIANNFEISAHAVKRQARVFKSVLKLDKNFHIYIHGNRELIEKGYDDILKRHFYKIYFDQES